MRIRAGLFVAILLLAVLPAHSQERRLKLTFVGDIMAHTVNYLVKDYGVIYADIVDYLQADTLTFANLETPVDDSRPYSSYPRFNVHADYLQAAVEAGIEVFSLANNHAYDQGQEGIFQTLISMARVVSAGSRPICFSGIRGNLKKSFAPTLIETEGLKIGFLAATQMVNVYQRHPYVQVADYRRERDREAFLRTVRDQAPEFDLFIVSYHGGREYALKAEREKEEFFNQLIACGVHIVYAHHPHVLQPARMIRLEGSGRLIIASAGNLISGMTWSADPADPQDPRAYRGDSALWRVEVEFKKATQKGWEASVERVEPILVTNFKNERGQMVIVPYLCLLDRKLPEDWSGYYRVRYRAVQDLLGLWQSRP